MEEGRKPKNGRTSDAVAELPRMAVDNQPVSTPLAILAHKMISSETGPKHLVLVQWQGLHPDETLWEEWMAFQAMHHLEDKVLFDGRGDDTNRNEEVQAERPKRHSIPLIHLRDYVMT